MSPTASAWLGAALLLMASIYLGTGFSMMVLQLPGMKKSLNPSNFDDRMNAPIRRATTAFAVQVLLMVLGGIVLTVAEWDEGAYRYAPLLYVVATVAATAWTMLVIFPVNQRLRDTNADPDQFRRLLDHWTRLSTVRFALWIVEWAAITSWFLGLAVRARS